MKEIFRLLKSLNELSNSFQLTSCMILNKSFNIYCLEKMTKRLYKR